MPPKTAIRLSSSIAASARGIGTNGAVLVARVTGVVPQRIRDQGLLKRGPKPGVGRFNQNRADMHAAVRDHAAVVAEQPALVKIVHHLRSDALLRAITASALDLSTETQNRQNLEPRPVIANVAERLHEAFEQSFVVGIVAHASNRNDGQETVSQKLAHAAERAVEGAGAANRVVVRSREAIDRHTKFQTVPRCLICS